MTPTAKPDPPRRTSAEPQGPPGPSGDPCARFHDLRRDYCYQVLDRLTGN
ncbi:hypothetical protein JOL79_02785 [Microbispora sp. RL4-1S]|uniref:Uncharacterized protein n=1 Tax=Microbispora oryzae TaxID=2806554 RepID=A0A940WKC2_9ACTN|nr:hypothetical protein [Microbispora oryzae]MBP2702726.1 hypothetical protein [Microbispora oryzae]